MSTLQHFGVNAAQGVHGVREVRARCIVPYVASPPTILKNVSNRDNGRSFPVTFNKDTKVQNKFRSGWISLFQEDYNSSSFFSFSSDCARNDGLIVANASCIPLGAYVTVSTSGCIVTEGAQRNSKKKSEIPYGASFEVVATRMEFEESDSFRCRCGRDILRGAVAVRGLVASG